MKRILLVLYFVLSLFLFAVPAEARSGCCSHHDGVMSNGCGCNDGTPLSNTCAPYYTCSENTAPVATAQPVYIPPTKVPYVAPTSLPTRVPTAFVPRKVTIVPTIIHPLLPTKKPVLTKSPIKIATKSAVKKIIHSTPKPNNFMHWFLSIFRM